MAPAIEVELDRMAGGVMAGWPGDTELGAAEIRIPARPKAKAATSATNPYEDRLATEPSRMDRDVD